jgi:hypothetical protein
LNMFNNAIFVTLLIGPNRRFRSIGADIVDSVIVGVVVSIQFLFSVGLLLVAFLFNYGGANPTVFLGVILFALYGIISACFLTSRLFHGRIAGLGWHVVFVTCLVWGYIRHVPAREENPLSFAKGETWALFLYAGAVVYVLVTAIVQLRKSGAGSTSAGAVQNS